MDNIDNIQAQNLLSRNKSVFQYDEDMLQVIDMAIEALKERPQGKWVRNSLKPNINIITHSCSLCGFISNSNKYNYCPSCGADMKGGVK